MKLIKISSEFEMRIFCGQTIFKLSLNQEHTLIGRLCKVRKKKYNSKLRIERHILGFFVKRKIETDGFIKAKKHAQVKLECIERKPSAYPKI